MEATVESSANGATGGRALRLGCYQVCGTPKDVDSNIALAERLLEESAGVVDLLLLPELFLGGYNIGAAHLALAEPLDGPAFQRISAAARRAGVAVVYGYAESIPGRSDRCFNSAAVIGASGERLANYRKTHLYAPYGERDYFVPGDTFAPVVEIKGVKLGVLICFDVEFPEPVRALALQGAELIVVPTANADAFVNDTVVPVRAAENGIFVVYCNRVGTEFGFRFNGGSVVAGPDGKVLSRAPSDAEHKSVVRLEPDAPAYVKARRANPYLSELGRRPELYAALSHPAAER